jgi:hypothetical protein
MAGVQQETEGKHLVALSNVAKFHAEVRVLRKRSLEDRLDEIGATEQMWKKGEAR